MQEINSEENEYFKSFKASEQSSQRALISSYDKTAKVKSSKWGITSLKALFKSRFHFGDAPINAEGVIFLV